MPWSDGGRSDDRPSPRSASRRPLRIVPPRNRREVARPFRPRMGRWVCAPVHPGAGRVAFRAIGPAARSMPALGPAPLPPEFGRRFSSPARTARVTTTARMLPVPRDAGHHRVGEHRMTRDSLQALSRKDLADLARRRGVDGWHDLKKDDLIAKILKAAAKSPRPASRPATAQSAAKVTPRPVVKAAKKSPSSNGTHKPSRNGHTANGKSAEVNESARLPFGPTKDLSEKAPNGLASGYAKDRIVVMVRDPYWLHAYWELTHQAVQRAEAALGQDWHGARPILRSVDVSTPRHHQHLRGAGPRHRDPRRVQQLVHRRAATAALVPRGHRLRRPPRPVLRAGPVERGHHAEGRHQRRDRRELVGHRPEKADRIYAMSSGFDPTRASSLELKQIFEERLRRPLGSPAVTGFGSGGCFAGQGQEVLVPARRRADRLRRDRARTPASRCRASR